MNAHTIPCCLATFRGGAVLVQPEHEPPDVCIPPQVAGVLRINKRAVVFRIDEGPVVYCRSLSRRHTGRRQIARHPVATIPVVIRQVKHHQGAATVVEVSSFVATDYGAGLLIGHRIRE